MTLLDLAAPSTKLGWTIIGSWLSCAVLAGLAWWMSRNHNYP